MVEVTNAIFYPLVKPPNILHTKLYKVVLSKWFLYYNGCSTNMASST